MSAPDTSPGGTATQTPPIMFGVAALGGALLIDAAIETFLAGSSVRWWIVGAAVLYAAATVSLWRMRAEGSVLLAVTVFGLLGLVAVTAWMPGGLTDGVRVLGQPTSRIMAALVAAGVTLAAMGLVRVRTVPLAVRAAAGTLAAYGVLAFVVGAIDGTPLPVLLSGQSLWRRLPTVLQGAVIGGFVVLPIGLVWSAVTTGLRRPPALSVRAEVWKIAALVASFATVLAGLPLRSGGATAIADGSSSEPEDLAALLGIDPNAPKPTRQELDAALANSLRALEDGEREMPRDHWDPAYVLASLGSDPQRLFAWVQGNTFWIPYRGLLRGSAGVLMDRLGNSLDRAALLAVLLQQSGQVVRLARGSLPPAQAVELVRVLSLERYAASQAARATAGADEFKAIAAQYELDEASLARTFSAQSEFATRKYTQLLNQVRDQTQRLATAVGSGAKDHVALTFDRVLAAAQDHWWVQLLENGAWQDYDLAATGAGMALTNPTETIEIESFPDELRHRITVRVIAEQWANGGLIEHVALEDGLKPAQLLGVPIVLRFMPSKWPAEFPAPNMTREDALRALALEQHEWTPALVVGTKSGIQMAIRDTGDVVRPREPAQEFGETTGGKMGGLAKRLDDALGPSTPPQQPAVPLTVLTATWIEYEVHQPGEQSQKTRRALFDLIGPAARATKPGTAPQLSETALVTRSLALMRETEILPIVCRFRPEFVPHLWAQSLLANRDLIASAVRGEQSDDFARTQEVAKKLSALPTQLYGLALARFEWSRFGNSIFVDKTNILTRHTFLARVSNGFNLIEATDIVANDVGVDVMTDDAFAVRLEQGVFDTNAETFLASDQPNSSNAGWALASSRDWTTLRGPDDSQLSALRLSDDVRRRIAGDLAAGYVVIAPKEPVTVGAGTFSGWWRVNPRTGQALGMGSTGWGQDMVEYLIIVAIDMQLAYAICKISGGKDRQCFEEALIWGIFSALLNGLALVALGARAAAGLGAGGRAAEGLGGGARAAAAKTAPDIGETLPQIPFSKTQPGGSGPGLGPGPKSGPGPGGGGPGPGPGPGPKPSGPPYPEWSPELKEAWDQLRRASDRMVEFINNFPKGQNEAFQKLWREEMEALKNFQKLKYPDMHPVPSGPSPNAPTLPGTGPRGTQIIPRGPNAPTQPQINCGGNPCVSPYGKTETGLGGILNTLGRKGGG